MFVRERKEIDVFTSEKGLFATIKLSNLAKPETVSITYRKEKLIPTSFDSYGHPVFSEQQAIMYEMKEDDLKRKKGSHYRKALATVEYETVYLWNCAKALFEFDSVIGISKKLTNLSDINSLIKWRKRYAFQCAGDKLNRFIIFGCFVLTSDGRVESIIREDIGKFKFKECERYEDFLLNNKNVEYIAVTPTEYGFTIPKDGEKCPCCGKLFTTKDLINNPCISFKGDSWHFSCYKEYQKMQEIFKFNTYMEHVYKAKDFTCELLPNGYCHRECCAHIPWFKFHTIHGDIIMGKRKRVISIEWQENYKNFNFAEIFKDENVTKWEEEGKRGIHAWSNDDAIKYLENAVKTVDPEYRR